MTEERKQISSEIGKRNKGRKLGKQSDELIKKRTSKLKGRISPNKGNKMSEESKTQISEKIKGKVFDKDILEKATKAKYRKIYQYDLDYNFIKEWESIKSITQEIKVDRHTISRACKTQTKAKGFYWLYAVEVEKEKALPHSKAN